MIFSPTRAGLKMTLELKWDGSFLGVFTSSIIKEKRTFGKDVLWQLSIEDKTGSVFARKVDTRLATVIDELKPVFGLSKIGTHALAIGKKTYLLIRPNYVDNKIIIDDTLDNTTVDNKMVIFRQQVQDVFAFRELMGLTTNMEKYIRVRKPLRGLMYPISYNDISASLEKEKASLSKKVISKWFDNPDKLAAKIERMVNDDPDAEVNQDYITNILAKYRTKIENVITRVDKDSIWMSVYIIERIQKALMASPKFKEVITEEKKVA